VTTADSITTIDAIATDLVTNVGALNPPTQVHKYGSWNPDLLLPDSSRHLAVFVDPDAQEEADYVEAGTNSSVEIIERYSILIWEPAGNEADRQAEDTAGDSAFLQLHFDARARLLRPAQSFGGAYLTKYSGVAFGDRTRLVRWCRLDVTGRRYVDLQ
jgi:hypothetical protein